MMQRKKWDGGRDRGRGYSRVGKGWEGGREGGGGGTLRSNVTAESRGVVKGVCVWRGGGESGGGGRRHSEKWCNCRITRCVCVEVGGGGEVRVGRGEAPYIEK